MSTCLGCASGQLYAYGGNAHSQEKLNPRNPRKSDMPFLKTLLDRLFVHCPAVFHKFLRQISLFKMIPWELGATMCVLETKPMSSARALMHLTTEPPLVPHPTCWYSAIIQRRETVEESGRIDWFIDWFMLCFFWLGHLIILECRRGFFWGTPF